MKIVIDIEANALNNPTKIWVVVCKDIDTNEYFIFRENDKEKFNEFAKGVSLWIGHNFLEYDYPVLNALFGLHVQDIFSVSCDTLIISRLVDFSRPTKHSIESYGLEFNFPKIEFTDFSKYTQEMEEYCKRDVDICHKIYLKYLKYISNKEHREAIVLEHRFQYTVVNSLSNNGFSFNIDKGKKLLLKVTEDLSILDKDILEAFKPKLTLVREVVPRVTKHGTIARNSIPKILGDDLSPYSADAPFCLCEWKSFNPSSHKQLIEVLHEAGWKPENKTKTHLDVEREIRSLERQKKNRTSVDLTLQKLYTDKYRLEKYGWKIDEHNLDTLPSTAPSPARLLAKRILLESRRRTLTEWLSLAHPQTERIYGKFQGIGAWTHRMAHQKPNTANIPNEFDTQGKKKLLGKEMRSLWRAPRNRLLVGVDAEGIQLRIFAHYINDAEFTEALVKGKKSDGTDPHSLNQSILGDVCKSRAAAKRFIYALLLGAGIGKLSQVLDTSEDETRRALDRLLERYSGWRELKASAIPRDAKRGWFSGLDGRKVSIPGSTKSSREHLCMSGYLQNGEAVVMKKATLRWHDELNDLARADKILAKYLNWLLVDLVHDEWQTECANNMEIAILIAKTQCKALEEVGVELDLKCPLAGSFWNDDHNDYNIATNWSDTH